MTYKTTYHLQIENITNNGTLSKDNLDDILLDIGKNISICLNVERVNIWLFNELKHHIICIGNYEASKNTFSKGEILHEKDMPNYYKFLKESKILSVNNVYTDHRTEELALNYCKSENIFALMDVPIHIAGKLVGVICFEQTKKERIWTEEEQYFALSISQVVSLAIETKKRKSAQLKLEKALEEKEILLAEMHHRIKNNLNILNSMLRMQADETENEDYKILAKDFESRIFSIAKIHEQLYTNNNYYKISLKSYIDVLLQEAQATNQSVHFEISLDEYWVKNDHIVPIGLICNEILTNTLKHAFDEQIKTPSITIKLTNTSNGHCLITIKDNGLGFDVKKALSSNSSFGLSLIFDLAEQIDAKIKVTSSKGETLFQIAL